jgi:hypothetical protein
LFTFVLLCLPSDDRVIRLGRRFEASPTELIRLPIGPAEQQPLLAHVLITPSSPLLLLLLYLAERIINNKRCQATHHYTR